ncbi:NAD(P)/FAD-dependent oxidoreductase [Phenylobacterium soli]|uniref:D-amino-acid oxidase n=1 Tax=Phenylobacterium soli TaxID=2170551 RepID=A0A328AM06_9CAUL|nr:FAD-dependent oxidoreductase [Phenylobacterium soli]RAK55026.1 D-amino-acid oxidase [Phenylobacterium soli]
MTQRADGRAKVTVAGAGALGLSAALALADAGCEVTVYDPAPHANASAVAAGMIAPVFEAVLDPEAAPHFDLLMRARDLWPELARRSGVVLDRSGAMAVGAEPWLEGVEAALIRLGVHGIDLPRRTAEELAPGLSEVFAGGVLVREDWRLEPGAALAALRAAAEAAGVSFRNKRALDAGEADWLVVATGADAGLVEVAPELAQLTPIKGHILRMAGAPAGRVSVRGQGVYAAPADGGLSIGATMEVGVADPTPDPSQAELLQAAGARLFPALAEARPQVFTGVRAATPDGLPLVGFSKAKGVVLATGARRNGWLLAPLAAKLVAACVTGAETGAYAGRFDPQRF